MGKGFSGTLFVPDNTVSQPWQLHVCAPWLVLPLPVPCLLLPPAHLCGAQHGGYLTLNTGLGRCHGCTVASDC